MVGRWDAVNHSPLLAAAYDQAWNQPASVADGILSLLNIDNPTPRQSIGAMAIGEMVAHFNALFRGLAKG